MSLLVGVSVNFFKLPRPCSCSSPSRNAEADKYATLWSRLLIPTIFPFLSTSAEYQHCSGPQLPPSLPCLLIIHVFLFIFRNVLRPSFISHFSSILIGPSSCEELGYHSALTATSDRDLTSRLTNLLGGQIVLGDRTSNISGAFVSNPMIFQRASVPTLPSHPGQRSCLARTHSRLVSSPTCFRIAFLPGASAWALG